MFIRVHLWLRNNSQGMFGSAEGGGGLRYNFLVEINQPAPDFELTSLQGELVRLRDLRGKIVILNFWSCECPHSERTDRDLMAMFVQWREDVALLPIAANRIETPDAMAEAARHPAPADGPDGQGAHCGRPV